MIYDDLQKKTRARENPVQTITCLSEFLDYLIIQYFGCKFNDYFLIFSLTDPRPTNISTDFRLLEKELEIPQIISKGTSSLHFLISDRIIKSLSKTALYKKTLHF